MKKIGEFIYPWGNGHYSRMMRLNYALNEIMGDQLETHFFSKSEILEKLIKKFPEFKDIFIAEPGFLNIEFNEDFWQKFLSNLLALGVSIIELDETSVAPIPVSIKILLVSVFINKQFIDKRIRLLRSAFICSFQKFFGILPNNEPPSTKYVPSERIVGFICVLATISTYLVILQLHEKH